MPETFLSAPFKPTVTRSDWITMLSVLRMYQHNTDYRELYQRMAAEAKVAGIPLPDEIQRNEAAPGKVLRISGAAR